MGEEVAEELRARVRERTQGLTCSVGIAPNRMLAKVRPYTRPHRRARTLAGAAITCSQTHEDETTITERLCIRAW